MEYHILWPDHIKPEEYRVRSYNSLFIAAPAEKIWNVLIDATQWPTWYSNSKNVRIVSGEQTLAAGSRFVWKTFGLTVKSTVIDWVPFERIGWDAHELGGVGYHGWRIIPVAGGCVVVTEEVQRGWGVFLTAPFVKRGLQTQHQRWLEGVRERVG